MLVTFEGRVGIELEYYMKVECSEDSFADYIVFVKDLITGLTYKGECVELNCVNDIDCFHTINHGTATVILKNPVVVEVKQ